MRRDTFSYELPDALIAQRPTAERDQGRLLCLDREGGQWQDRRIRDLPDLLTPGDLMVVNDTRVIRARLFGRKQSGGRVEILTERLLGDARMLAQVRASKAPVSGSEIHLDSGEVLSVLAREGPFHVLGRLDGGNLEAIVERSGHVPLPPYIRREDDDADRERYQTIFARHPGAVAAPTAGLHFSETLVKALGRRGVDIASLTLHVGAGTFQPLRVETVEEHVMHREHFRVPEALCGKVSAARARGGRVVAVGTTVVRALESAATDAGIEAQDGETDIFIFPGYRFRIVDALLTNFHLPESTLLMLVCAFAGTDNVLAAYRHAVAERYRFFSYGDAMFIANGAAALPGN